MDREQSEKLRHSIYISCVKELGSNPNDVEDVGMLHLIGGLLYGRDYHGLSLPLHQIALEAQHGKRGWDTVNEFMIRLPDFVLSFALLLKDSWDMVTPLHVASREAPLSTVRIMLKYAAITIGMKDVGGNLPIHIASHYNNDLICKEFTKEYPEALIVTNGYGLTPFDYGHKESTRAIYHGIVEHMIPTEYRFHSFGELLEESLYKSIHPIPVLLLEAVYNRRTLEDIQFFLDQLLDNSIALQCFSQDKFRNNCFQRIVDINSKFELPSSLLSRLYYALSGSAQGYFSLVRNEMTMKQIFGDLMSQGIGSHLSDLHLLMIQKRLT